MTIFIQLKGDDCLFSRGVNDPIWLRGSFREGYLMDSDGKTFLTEIKEHKRLKDLMSLSFYLFDEPQEKIVLRPKNLLNHEFFQTHYLGMNYSVKIHMGYKYSFFENNQQFAFLDRFEHPNLSNASLKLSYHSNADLYLLIGMVFFLLKRRTKGFDGRELTFNVGFRYKYDENWRANELLIN